MSEFVHEARSEQHLQRKRRPKSVAQDDAPAFGPAVAHRLKGVIHP